MAKKNKKKESNITTIKINRETKQRLDKFKEYDRETYTELIKKILNILNICRSNPGLANRILRDIERSKKRDNLVDNPERAMKRKNILKEINETQNKENNYPNQSFSKQLPKPRVEFVK